MACLCPVRKNSPPSGLTNPIEFFDMAASWPHRSLNSDRPFRIRRSGRFRAISYHSLIRPPLEFAGFSIMPVVRDGAPATLCLHVRIIGAATALGWNPGDVLVGVFDVASLAVDAVLRVDDKARRTALLHPFVDPGWAIARGGPAIDVMLRRLLQRRIGHLEM